MMTWRVPLLVRRIALVLGISIAASLPLHADRADDFITAEMRRQRIPGLSLAILERGRILKIAGYGLADRERKRAATPDTVYKIASVSKQFIAAGILRLVQDGRLTLDASIREQLDDAPPAWGAITIRHLLTHTSGLVREGPAFDPHKVQTDAAVIRSAYGLPLRFTPGDKHEYSNLGYFVLAEIISRAAGTPWPQYLRDLVFAPLGMTSTAVTTADGIAHRIEGYVDNDALRPAPRWAALRPSGAFVSSVRDLAKWDAALYTDTVLDEAARLRAWTPVTLNDGNTHPYGFGWILATVRGHRLVHHPGGMPGTRANVARFVDAGITIIVLMNLNDVDIDAIVHGLAKLYLPAPGQAR